MKRIIISGAAGFTGCNLVEELLRQGYFIYAVVRPESLHNARLPDSERLHLIYADMSEFHQLDQQITEPCDVFFHLAWQGGRHDFSAQQRNISVALGALEAASRIGCQRFVCTGSQAEYGIQTGLITEETCPHPADAYGSAKLAACILSRQRAAELGMDWIWGRIFSLYGRYEPEGRMLPDLVRALRERRTFSLSAATQNWDYLYSEDGARALAALGEHGRSGEIYNIANGAYRPLREFTEVVRELIAPDQQLSYGDPVVGGASLQPSVTKIQADTGWRAEADFLSGVRRGYLS